MLTVGSSSEQCFYSTRYVQMLGSFWVKLWYTKLVHEITADSLKSPKIADHFKIIQALASETAAW